LRPPRRRQDRGPPTLETRRSLPGEAGIALGRNWRLLT